MEYCCAFINSTREALTFERTALDRARGLSYIKHKLLRTKAKAQSTAGAASKSQQVFQKILGRSGSARRSTPMNL